MDIYIYSDESGVFDVAHNSYFVFGGLILFGKESKDKCEHYYAHAEKTLRNNINVPSNFELKTTRLDNAEKSQLFRSMNKFKKFGVVIKQGELHKQIFSNKKTKQRYLDFAYKIALKKALSEMINTGILSADDVDTIHVYVDEHTTATDGKYELKEALEQEFKYGTFNYDYQMFFPPLFPNMKGVELRYCDSSKVRLVRASDIIANKLYFLARTNQLTSYNPENFHIEYLPRK